jgi:hypothetical protein
MRVALLLLLAGCASPAILGGPTPENTSHLCADGLRCPNYLDCPSLAGGNCEQGSGIPEAARKADAGSHCRMTMMGIVCLDERL